MKNQKVLCASCKKSIQVDSGFCANCGAKIEESTIIKASDYKKGRLLKFTKFLSIGIISLAVLFLIINLIGFIMIRLSINRATDSDELFIALSENYNKSGFPIIIRDKVAGNTVCKMALETRDRRTLELALHYGFFRNSKGFSKGKSKYRDFVEKEYYDLMKEVGVKPEQEGIFIDPRDKNEYKWVKIGDQVWMAEDMRYTAVSGSANEYFLREIGEVQPPGWHVPSDGEFQILELNLGLKLFPDVNNSIPDAPEVIGLNFCSKGIYYQIEKDNGSTKLDFQGRYWTTTRKNFSGRNSYVIRDINLDYRKEFFEINNYQYGVFNQEYRVRCVSDLSVEELNKEYELAQLVKDMNLYEVYDAYKDVNDPFLNVREGPGPTYSIIFKLVDGDLVEVVESDLGTNNMWCKINYPGNSITGFVHKRYIRKVDQ